MPEGNALGAVFTGSPNTSSYSNPQVNALLAGGGGGSNAMTGGESNALGVAQQAQQLQSGKVTIDQQTFNLAKAKLDAVHQLLGAVVANPNDDTFTTQLGIGVQAGTVDPKTASDLAAHVASFGGDRAKIQQFALDGLNNNASHQEALQQAYGAPGLTNTGGGFVSTLTRTGPNAGVTLSGAPAIPATTTPGEKIAAGRVATDGDGGKTFVPGSSLYDSQGNYTGGGTGSTSGAAGDPGYFQNLARKDGGAAGVGSAPPPLVGGNKAPPLASNSSPPPMPPAAAGLATGSVPTPQDPGGSAGSSMMTPTPQTLPVITKDQATAAYANWQAGKASAADRNVLRGFAIQNNGTLKNLGAFEPQPAGVGAGVVIPPQPGQPSQSVPAGQSVSPAPAGVAVSPGRQPPASMQVQGAGQGSSGAASGVGPSGLTDSLSPGRQASLTTSANGYAALSADVSAPTGVNQRVFQLRTALNALRNTQTGLGTAQRQQLVGYMASLPGGLDKWMPGVDPESASNYDVATKYLTAYSLNTPGAARSDAGLSTAQSANANTGGMMQKAAQDVTLSNIGLEVGKRALTAAFDKSGADPGTFNKFATQWSQGVDPRAFALGDMTPAERSTLFDSLQGQQRTNFIATIRKGIAANVISPNDLKGATGGQ